MQQKHCLHFTKMHSNGNDFMTIDRLSQSITDNKIQANIKRWANRNTGIGFDGLIIIDPPTQADQDFNYRIINSSGAEVAQCGNGAVCFAHYVTTKNYIKKPCIKIQISNRHMVLTVKNHATINTIKLVEVALGVPVFDKEQIPCSLDNPLEFNNIQVGDQQISVSCVSMGNPHAVMLVDDINKAPVASIGKQLQEHSCFAEQVNVGFMQIISKNHIKLRVFERGVGETLCCGSGACAATVVGINHKLLDEKVTVELLGGQVEVNWQSGLNKSVMLSSNANKVFNGTVFYE